MADYALSYSGSQVESKLGQVDTNATAIGTLTNLTTTEKSNLVGAVNEVNTKATAIATTSALGRVKPDGTSITADNDGTIHGISGITLTELWTNSAPTSSFSAQSVSVDLSNYDVFLIRYLIVDNATTYVNGYVLTAGGEQRHMVINRTNSSTYVRDVTPSTSAVAFTDCASQGTTTNTHMIPYKIIGVK